MKDGIIFVAGIYGVGKSTLCERLGLSIGIPCYSAGDLISALNGETYGRNKTVVNKEKNQDILVAAVNDRLQKDTAFILAGHFCIFDKSFKIENASYKDGIFIETDEESYLYDFSGDILKFVNSLTSSDTEITIQRN